MEANTLKERPVTHIIETNRKDPLLEISFFFALKFLVFAVLFALVLIRNVFSVFQVWKHDFPVQLVDLINEHRACRLLCSA